MSRRINLLDYGALATKARISGLLVSLAVLSQSGGVTLSWRWRTRRRGYFCLARSRVSVLCNERQRAVWLLMGSRPRRGPCTSQAWPSPLLPGAAHCSRRHRVISVTIIRTICNLPLCGRYGGRRSDESAARISSCVDRASGEPIR